MEFNHKNIKDLRNTSTNPRHLKIAAVTDIGVIRRSNEDCFLFHENSGPTVVGTGEHASHSGKLHNPLVVVADGCGGGEAGLVASTTTAKTILSELLDSHETENAIEDKIRRAVAVAHQKLREFDNDPDLMGAGSTVVLFWWLGSVAYLARVGNSTIFIIRDGRIEEPLREFDFWATRWVPYRPDTFPLPPDEVFPIFNLLGSPDGINISLARYIPRLGDRLILCTDGLTQKIEREDVLATIGTQPDLNRACEILIEEANRRGGEDNVTVVACDIDGEESPDRPPLENDLEVTSHSLCLNPKTEEYVRDVVAWYLERDHPATARKLVETIPFEGLRKELRRLID